MPERTLTVPVPLNPELLLRGDVSVVRRGRLLMDGQWSPSGVTGQFLEDADTYHARYFKRVDFEELVGRMLTLAGTDRAARATVLDIGSGGGSSVFAAAKLLPNAHIAGSDISPNLLGKMADFSASRPELRDRISAYCFDLHMPFFRRDSFDLVLGCAVLHHLIDPYAALKNVVSALKEGGKIVLCEPLEAGNLIDAIIYEGVLSIERERGAEDGRLSKLMLAIRRDIQARLGVPVQQPHTKFLDDKWVFDPTYLAALSAQLGCKNVEIFPVLEDLGDFFERSFRDLLAASGNSDIELSGRVLDLLREFDSGISAPLKVRLCSTGIFVFTK